MYKKRNKLAVLGLSALMATSTLLPQEIAMQEAYAQATKAHPTMNVVFSESLDSSVSKTITVPDLVKVKNITSDTGKVSYTQSGDQLTIMVSEGEPTRTTYNPMKEAKAVSTSKNSPTNSFAATTSYNSDGFTGTLAKSGVSRVASGEYVPEETKEVTAQTSAAYSDSLGFVGTLTPYVYSGSYTPADEKYVSGQTSSSYNSDGYSGTLSRYLYSGSYTAGDTKYVSGQTSSYYNTGGYSGYLSQYVYSGSYQAPHTKRVEAYHGSITWGQTCLGGYYETKPKPVLESSRFYSSDGYWGTLYKNETAGQHPEPVMQCGVYTLHRYLNNYYYAGNVTNPGYDTRVYRYAGNVSSPSSDTRVYRYRGYVQRPESDTRVYRYQGTATKPASDTRVYEQTYSGTAYKGGDDVFYGYNVNIEYSVDETPPANASFSASTSSPTNQPVTVSVGYPTDAATRQIQINTGAWQMYTGPIALAANGTVSARSYDEYGNLSAVTSYNVTNIDKVAPEKAAIQADVTGPTNQNVTVTPTFPNDAAVKEVRINGGEWKGYTGAIVFTDNGKLEARSTDAVGNTSAVETYTVSNIDKAAPERAGLEPNTKAPTNQDVTVAATFPADAHSKEVKVNDGEWTAYTKAIVLAQNGTVEVRSTDDAGNTSAITKYEVTNIDKVAPDQPSAVSSNTAPTKEALQVSATFPADADQKEYKTASGDWTAYTGPVTVKANDTLTFRATDDAGNTSQTELVIENFDFAAPEAPAFNFAIDTVTVTDGKDSHQVKESRYRTAGETDWNVYTEALVFADGVHHLELVTVDSVGNVSDIKNAKFHAYRSQLKVATDATVRAEVTPAYHSRIDAARTEVAKLPDAAPEKELLNDRLTKAADALYLKDATTKVELAERYKKEPYLQNAQDAIDRLSDIPERTALQERLDSVHQAIRDENYVDPNGPDGDYEPGGSILDSADTIQDVDVKGHLKRWASAVSQAEKYYSRISIVNAVSRMNEVPAGVLANTNYQPLIQEMTQRTLHLKNAWNAGVENREIENNMSNAFRLVDYYEMNRTDKTKDAAQLATDVLPEGDVKKSLQARIDRISLPTEEAPEEETPVEEVPAEEPDQTPDEGETPTEEEIPAEVPGEVPGEEPGESQSENDPALIAAAEKALGYAERYGSSFYKKKAQEAVNLLNDGEEKTALQARIDAL